MLLGAFVLLDPAISSFGGVLALLLVLVGAAISGRFLFTGAGLVALGLVTYLLLPSSEVTAAGLAFFIPVLAAFRRSHRWAIPLTIGLFILGFWVLVLHSLGGMRLTPAIAAFLPIVLLLAVGSGILLSRFERRVATERSLAAGRIRDLRLELARDLHDSAVQEISRAAMRAHIAALRAGDAADAKAEFEAIAAHCNRAAHDLRLLLANLRDPNTSHTSRPMASTADLKTLLDEQFERLTAEGFTLDTIVQIDELDSVQLSTIAKITVEAVTNIIKHATPGGHCRITLAQDVEGLLAEYSNPCPVRQADVRRLGLTGIFERAELAGGHADIRQGHGWWHLSVDLPAGSAG